MKKTKKKNKKKAVDSNVAISPIKALRERRQDAGYVNYNTGLGGQYDNVANSFYESNGRMSRTELEDLFDTNWLAKRAVKAPVDDMLSNWITFTRSNDDDDAQEKRIEELEDKIEDHNIKGKLKEAMIEARNHWGSAMFFDFYGQDETMPFVNPSGIKKIEVVDSWHCRPDTFYNVNIHGEDHPKLGEPEHYRVIIQRPGGSTSKRIHESRLVIIDGMSPSSKRVRVSRQGWGFSVLESFEEAMKGFGIGMQAAADVLAEFFYKILKMKDLAEYFVKNEDDTIIEKAQKSINLMGPKNVGVCDVEEEILRTSATVTGMDGLIDRLVNQVCAAIEPGIPHSVLFSAEGGALGGNSAESDEKNYLGKISVKQENEARPALNKILLFLGYSHKDYHFTFNKKAISLREELENQKIISEVDTNYINAEVVLAEEVTNTRVATDNFSYQSYQIDEELRSRVEEERLSNNEEEEEGNQKEEKE